MSKVKEGRAKKYGCLKSFLTIVLVLLILVGVGYAGAHFMLSKVDREQLSDLTISEEVLSNKKDLVLRILLYLGLIQEKVFMRIHVQMQ